MTEVDERPRLFELDDVSESLSWRIPKHIRCSIEQYVWHGTPTDGFLRAVLLNDLMGAIARADETSLRGLRVICQYVYNAVPSVLHGSDEAVRTHIERGLANPIPPNEGAA